MKKSLFILALSTLFLTSCKDNTAVATGTVSEETTETKPVAVVGKVETASFTIEGMSCEIMCAAKIQKELTATEGVQKATIDFEKKLATIEYDAAVTSPEKLIEKVEAVNGGESYKVSNLKTSADHAILFQEKEKKKSRKQRKTDEKAAAEAATTSTSTAKPACCSSKKACSEKKETL
jgi:mercuric ion binding protein